MDQKSALGEDDLDRDRPGSIGVDWLGDSLVLELPRAFRWRLGNGLLVVLVMVVALADGRPRRPAELVVPILVWLCIGFWVVLGLTRRQIRLSPTEISLSLLTPWGSDWTRTIAWSGLQTIHIERSLSLWPYPFFGGVALIFRSPEQEHAFGHGLWNHEMEWLQRFLLDQLRHEGAG